MTTTLIDRIAASLAVGVMLAGTHPAVAAEEAHADTARPDLTLGGQPLARLLSEPMVPGAEVQVSLTLGARADGMRPLSARTNPATTGNTGRKRRARAGWIGAGIGAGLGSLAGTALKSYCHNEGGRHPCWTAVPVYIGLSALAGYGIGKGIGALANKLRGVRRPRPHRANGRATPGETNIAVAGRR